MCEGCLRKIHIKKVQNCPKCGRRNIKGKVCNEICNRQFNFDQLFVCCEYKKNSCLQKLITKFKYHHNLGLKAIFGKILINSGFDSFIPKDYTIVPVPISGRKIRKRGFNQSKILALLVKDIVKSERIYDCLSKNCLNKAQAHSNRDERLINLKNSIIIKQNYKNAISGQKVLLVDDVATTGATLNECSRVLKEAGAHFICGLVIARSNLSSIYEGQSQ